MHCIIGSGPAGAACAQALIARGAAVLMLDAGLELEPERASVVRELSTLETARWRPEQLAAITGADGVNTKGIPLKMLFGSDFPYRETREKIPWRGTGVGLQPSLALGGLSNVWGAAMLPYRDADIADWPVKNADLAPHYRAAGEIAGLAAAADDLAEVFPLYCENPQPLKMSRQAERLLQRLGRQRAVLRRRGWFFGRSRLAVRAAGNQSGAGCVYCGQCLNGCVYGCIYNSADTIRGLGAQMSPQVSPQKNFQYQPGIIVSRLRENSGGVRIEGFHRATGQPFVTEASRVYLAAGVIPTAQILLRSQERFDETLRLRDSQYYLFPFLSARRGSGAAIEARHTLSQLFLELFNPQISRHTVHLQIYTYNDIIRRVVQQSLGPLKMFTGPLAERLLIMQGYLHSDESAGIELELKRNGDADFLQLTARPNPRTRPVIRKILRELLSQSFRLGGMVLPPMLQMADPGRGFHTGGSFPMRSSPRGFESDCLGRPCGWSRVHAVDASVLPSVPATTITFTVMANAHRIGWAAAGL